MKRSLSLVGSLALLISGCSESPVEVGTTALVSVTPAHGATGVAATPPIEVRFDGPLASGAAALIALQVGDCPGPVVAGTWSASPDNRTLMFSPVDPLHPDMRYTIHVGGGMIDAGGALVDLERHGPSRGGTWVTEVMVLEMGGMGMGGMSAHAGPGWRGGNGFYGLAFAFTTGAS